MTVPSELQLAYNQISDRLGALDERASLLLGGIAKSVSGRYDCRIKPVESVLAKIEKDGVEQPFRDIEDLFAATIIVPNATFFPYVEEEVARLFHVVKTVPPRTKKPEEFIYDDRHFILKLRPEAGREDPMLESIYFELQVKTEMQAAASAISRPLAYKSRWLSWTRARLASRIRATVELADDLLARLAEAEPDSARPPAEDYEAYARLNLILEVLERNLAREQMPGDRRRLAITVDEYLAACHPRPSAEELERMLVKKDYHNICSASSLSAAGTVFIVLFLEGSLLKDRSDGASLRGDRRFLITSEMIDLCPRLQAIPSTRRVDLRYR